jgi:hypothetical protein
MVSAAPHFIPSYPYSKSKKKESEKNWLKAYLVQYKTKGKFLTLGKLPFGKAISLGQKAVATSLSQRFRLIPAGETTEEDIASNFDTTIFTRPKHQTVPLEFVERRGKTLKRGTGEVPEIQAARRAKPSKGSGIFGRFRKGL